MSEFLNPNWKNLGLFSIASAAAACAKVDAHLPLPVNRDQTRLYRAIFDELGANGTVALRGESGFIDSESGELLSHDELDDPKQHIGMASTVTGKTKWKSYSETDEVYTVCEMMSCDLAKSTGEVDSYLNWSILVSDAIANKKQKEGSQIALCSSSLLITSDTMPVSGLYEMSSTMHNGHSTWESTLNDLLLFKAASGAWQFDRTIESDTEYADNGDCPSSAQLASQICTFPVQIAAQDGLSMSCIYFR